MESGLVATVFATFTGFRTSRFITESMAVIDAAVVVAECIVVVGGIVGGVGIPATVPVDDQG